MDSPVQSENRDLNGASSPVSSPDALQEIGQHIAALKEYVALLIGVKIDEAKAALRKGIIYLLLASAGVFTVCAIIAISCALLLSGMAQGISVLFGTGIWLGNIVVGALALLTIVLGSWAGVRILERRHMERTRARYEQRKAQFQQLARRGTDDSSEV